MDVMQQLKISKNHTRHKMKMDYTEKCGVFANQLKPLSDDKHFKFSLDN